MKKSLLILLIPSLLIAGCNTSPSRKKSKSSSIFESSLTSEESSTSKSTTSGGTSITSGGSSGGTSKTSGTSGTSGTSSTSTSVTPPPVETQTIGQIIAQRKLNQLVTFEATYLRAITMNNEKVLMFADGTGYIGFRCTTNSDYINNRKRFHEYRVVGKLIEGTNALELAYDSSVGALSDSVINLPDSTPLSYDEYNTTLPISLANIGQIREKSALLTQDNKYNAYGEIVKFTAQYAQNEDDNSNQKCMFIDDNDEAIVVIQDENSSDGHPLYPLRDENNIGKYYEITGVISIRSSIPAILGLTCAYVPKTEEEESSYYVDEATYVTDEIATEIYKGNLTTDHFRALSNDYYFKLYHAEGWVVHDDYSYGFTLTEGGKLTPSGTSTIKGFYLVNGVKYSFEEYEGTKIDIYFKIESYYNQNHIWKIFLIEDLLPTLN